ncbi:hypothetical protein VTL71DRAFT_6250 [Oculimacula yallundae]|uniref:Uncharacterized protein n=1 Tax=Oculimacula yallundae TaxID=86028 RepID=A0ABR4BZV6_9HELO
MLKSLTPCNTFCTNTAPGVNGASCVALLTDEDIKKEPSMIKKDDNGYEWVIGQCTCGGEIVELAAAIAGVVAEALEELDNLLCGIFLQAMVTIVEIGVSFVPEAGPMLRSVQLGVKAAKSFAENGIDAAGFKGNWVGKVCGLPGVNFDPFQAFDPFPSFEYLTKYDDSYGTSVGCKRKNKSACKEMPAIPAEPPKKDKPVPEKSSDLRSDINGATSTPIVPPASSIVDSNPQLTSSTGANRELSVSSSASVPTDVPDTSTSTGADTLSTSHSQSLGEQDSATLSSSQASDADADAACKLEVRAPRKGKKAVEGKIGEEERSTQCAKNGREKTIHITKTKVPIGSYTSVLPQKCPKKNSQACYHYRSVMSVSTLIEDMIRFTCGATAGTGVDGGATKSWGSTALAKWSPKGDQQHNFAWANGFAHLIKVAKKKKGKLTDIQDGCDRDEWPPHYFWPGDKIAEKNGLEQRVRFIPSSENRGAGQIWAGFCNNNAALSTKRNWNDAIKSTETKSFIQKGWIQTVGQAIVDKPLVLQKTTSKSSSHAAPKNGQLIFVIAIVSTVSVNTGRAVFTIADWDGLPDDKDWHGLKENPCWPKVMVPDDPGWVLLTNDEFYLRQHPDLAKLTDRYKKLPDLALLQAALLKRDPINIIQEIDIPTALTRFGENGIPLEFQGVLPGIPKFSSPKPTRRIRGLDLRLPWKVLPPPFGPPDVDSYFKEGDLDPDYMDDEQYANFTSTPEGEAWSEWMDLFEESLQDGIPTVPVDVSFTPTPVGQGGATATPALEGVRVSAGLAMVTPFVV